MAIMKRTAQTTIGQSISFEGVGLHSGVAVNVTLEPGKPNSGVVIVRTDLPEQPVIRALSQNVTNTRLATTLTENGASVSTVEHLLAAVKGLGIDNLVVKVDGPEFPILDGSSLPFCEMFDSVGLVTQAAARRFLRLKRKVEVRLGEKWAVAEPSDRLEINAAIDWDHPMIGYQEFHFVEGETSFRREIAASRTFCMARDIEYMRSIGLIKGGSLECAVVMDEAGAVNEGGLRFEDELIRHKVLDALGDLQLAGAGLKASLKLFRTGHELHAKLLETILSDARNYEWVEEVVPTEKSRTPEYSTELGVETAFA